MSEQNIPFKKVFFGFKPEKVMDYVDELLKNSDFDQIRISELEKKTASFDQELAKKDAIIAAKNAKIAELEAEIEAAKNNVAVGIKCADCDIQKKAESLLGETLFDVKRFSLYLVNDAKQKASTTISYAKGTADAVSSRAKEILYNVDDISSYFSSQLEELRSSLSGLSTNLDAFCTDIVSPEHNITEDKQVEIEKPAINEDRVISDIKQEIYSELPQDVIDGINSLNESAKSSVSESDGNNNKNESTDSTVSGINPLINSENSIEDTDNNNSADDIVSNGRSDVEYEQTASEEINPETVSNSADGADNFDLLNLLNNNDTENLSEDDSVSADAENEMESVKINENSTECSAVDRVTVKSEDITSFFFGFDNSANESTINQFETTESKTAFTPEPFTLNKNRAYSATPEEQIPVNIVRNHETVMPNMVSPFADFFDSDDSNAELGVPSFSEHSSSADTAFKITSEESKLPVVDYKKPDKAEKSKDTREKNFTFVNGFKKPNMNISEKPVPSDPLPSDFE